MNLLITSQDQHAQRLIVHCSCSFSLLKEILFLLGNSPLLCWSKKCSVTQSLTQVLIKNETWKKDSSEKAAYREAIKMHRHISTNIGKITLWRSCMFTSSRPFVYKLKFCLCSWTGMIHRNTQYRVHMNGKISLQGGIINKNHWRHKQKKKLQKNI